MKAAVFYGKHDVRIEDVPMPVVGDGDVLIKIKACGVCGTDVHIFEGDKGAAEVTPPCILGHEFSGIVVDVGPKVSSVKVGDRVCVDPNKLCGKCGYCTSGIGHFCESITGIGTTSDGGFAEYCAVPESQVYHLAHSTSYEEGAMTEPVACCLHGFDMCEIKAGSHVVIIGGGMIGLIMVQLARIGGAASVFLVEPVAAKRKVGKQLGADIVIDPIKEDPLECISSAGVSRIDCVIECVGKTETIAQAIKIAGKKAIIMMFGLTKPDEELKIKPFEFFQKELTLKASYINPYTQQRALDLINSRRIDVSSMICSIEPLERLSDILAQPALRAKGKYIISPDK